MTSTELAALTDAELFARLDALCEGPSLTALLADPDIGPAIRAALAEVLARPHLHTVA